MLEMNFFQSVVPLEGWTGRTAFALMLAAMVLSPLAMAVGGQTLSVTSRPAALSQG